jgi:O-antigen/teichoic acid export membrane protein
MPESKEKSVVARRLLLGATTNWLAFAATLLVSFFLTPYLVHKLGDGPYGVWAFVERILAYFTLFDLGIAACVVRFVARLHATGEREELSRLVSTCLALFLMLGTLLFAVGGGLIPFLISPLAEAGVPRGEILGFALLMLGNLAVTLPLSLFPSILDGLERFAAKSLIRIVFLTIRTVGTILIMENRPSLWNLGLLFTACNLLEHTAFAIMARRLLPGLRFSRRYVDRPTLKRVKGYSLDAFLAMVAGRTCVQSGTIIVGLFFGAAPVTFFTLASSLVENAKALLRAATNTLTPAVSALEAAGNIDAIRRMFLRGTRTVLYLILPVHLGLIVFGRPFLTIWLGDALYADRCYPALVILSSTLTLVIAQSMASRVLYGMGKLRVFARAALLEAGVNILLSLLLGRWFGVVGVAIGVAVPNFLMCCCVIFITVRELRIDLSSYVSRAWLRPLAASMALLSVWLLVDWPMTGWTMLAVSITWGLVPYATTVLALEGRFSLRRFGKRLLSRRVPPAEQ